MSTKPIFGEKAGEIVVLNPTCRACGHRVPTSYLNAKGVCFDCQEPVAPLALSRSVVSVARMKSGVRRRVHHNGEIS